MFQAITTKFIPCANHRGSRVKATANAGSVTLNWDHSLNSEQNHDAAAKALANKFNWVGEWHSGGLPNNEGNCYVQGNIGSGPVFITYDERVTA
jgi:hypothetical protein